MDLDFLQDIIDSEFQKAQMVGTEAYSRVASNPGMVSMAGGSVTEAAFEVFDSWEEEWPMVDSVDYEGNMQGSHEAFDQCFGMTLGVVTQYIQECIDTAQQAYAVQQIMEFLEIMMEVLEAFA